MWWAMFVFCMEVNGVLPKWRFRLPSKWPVDDVYESCICRQRKKEAFMSFSVVSDWVNIPFLIIRCPGRENWRYNLTFVPRAELKRQLASDFTPRAYMGGGGVVCGWRLPRFLYAIWRRSEWIEKYGHSVDQVLLLCGTQKHFKWLRWHFNERKIQRSEYK